MKDCKQQWWKDARFGMFIHWGLYSLLGGEWKGQKTPQVAEWIMRHLQIPVEEYRALAKAFDPQGFDARAIVRLAQDAGMKYIVFTAKHHDGFAMYHSRCSAYNIVDATPFGRDPLRELADACRKAGVKLGIYYSQAQDWNEENGLGYGKPDSEKDYGQYYRDKCLPQLRELLTDYGEIGLMWFDTPMGMTEEESRGIYDLVKSLQPNCIVSGRIGNQLGEYMSTSDNFVPTLPYAGDWEVPATLNGSWGYKKDDHNWKTPAQVVELLTRVNSRGGNYLLNIGPDGNGVVPEESVRILRRVGAFIHANADSFYGTKAAPIYPYDLSWCMFTCRPYHLYAHIMDGRTYVHLPCVNTPVRSATLLQTGEALNFSQKPPSKSGVSRLFVDLPPRPDDFPACVIDLELSEENVEFDTLDKL